MPIKRQRQTKYHIIFRDKYGRVQERTAINLVPDTAINTELDTWYAGSAYTAAWYLMLLSASPQLSPVDTLAQHGGWTEETPYSGNRKALTWNAAVNGMKAANGVQFDIISAATVGGVGICDQASGTAGLLDSIAPFLEGDLSVASPGVLTINVTVNGQSA